MKVKLGVLIAGFGLLISGARIAAHHSTAAEFEEDKNITVKGTVSKVEWQNPHARFYVDVVGDDKAVVTWSFELASPNSLTRGGWGRRTLNVGDVITATGAPARSGKPMAVTHSVTTAEGKKLFTGTMGITDK
jgi:hypothetical protein